MKYFLALLVIIFCGLSGCKDHKNELITLLDQADKISFKHSYDSGKIFFEINDKSVIKSFCENIEEIKNNISSDRKMGELLFSSNNKIIFIATITYEGFEYVFKDKIYKKKIDPQFGLMFKKI